MAEGHQLPPCQMSGNFAHGLKTGLRLGLSRARGRVLQPWWFPTWSVHNNRADQLVGGSNGPRYSQRCSDVQEKNKEAKATNLSSATSAAIYPMSMSMEPLWGQKILFYFCNQS